MEARAGKLEMAGSQSSVSFIRKELRGFIGGRIQGSSICARGLMLARIIPVPVYGKSFM